MTTKIEYLSTNVVLLSFFRKLHSGILLLVECWNLSFVNQLWMCFAFKKIKFQLFILLLQSGVSPGSLRTQHFSLVSVSPSQTVELFAFSFLSYLLYTIYLSLNVGIISIPSFCFFRN